jgi:hypothetical protein
MDFLENEIIKKDSQKKTPNLTEVDVPDEVTALNVLVSFLNLANKRGCFSLEESGKIWECVKKFQKSAS